MVVRTTVALGDHHDSTVLIWWQMNSWYVIPSISIYDARGGDTMVRDTMRPHLSGNI